MVVFHSYVNVYQGVNGGCSSMFQPCLGRLNHAAPLRLAAALGTPWGSVGELLDCLSEPVRTLAGPSCGCSNNLRNHKVS